METGFDQMEDPGRKSRQRRMGVCIQDPLNFQNRKLVISTKNAIQNNNVRSSPRNYIQCHISSSSPFSVPCHVLVFRP